MFGPHQKSKPCVQEPQFNLRRRTKNLNIHEISLFKGMHTTVREPFKSRQLSRADHERKSLSTRELSIDQIKTRIREYLSSNGQAEAVQFLGSDILGQTAQRSTQEHFRVSMFKNNARKKVNLKILERLNPERYQQTAKDFCVREARINCRMAPKISEGQITANKQGFRTRLADYKNERRKRIKNSFFEGNCGQMKKLDIFSRPSTPRGWDSLMQPWRKWEENQQHCLN